MTHPGFSLICGLALLLGCSGPTAPPSDARSADYIFIRKGDGLLLQNPDALTDTAAFELQVRGSSRPVRGVEVHYRVTLGSLHFSVDTSDANGLTSYFWVIRRIPGDSASIYACAFVANECVEDRLIGFAFQ